MRYGSMDKFLQDYGSHANFSWGFDVFADTSATAMVNGFGGAPIMQSALNSFYNTPDGGQTPYMAALNLAESTIQNDPDLHSSLNPQYLIVFMSDGQPTDSTAAQLTSKVSEMVSLSPGKITFNTVYYGPGVATEAGLLQSLAQTGNGHFLNTNTNPSGLDFSIQDVVAVPCP